MQTPGDLKSIPPVMNLAITGISKVVQTMFGVQLELAGPPQRFSADDMSYGQNISLVRASGSWEIGIFGTDASCKNFGRLLLGMGENEEPAIEETLDLLGELVNMVCGLVKKRVEGGSELQLGVPMALLPDECKKYTPKYIPVFAQKLICADVAGELYLVLSEREQVGLYREAIALLDSQQVHDAAVLGATISVLSEAQEHLSADISEGFRGTLVLVESTLMGLLNEDYSSTAAAVGWARETLVDLDEALAQGTAHKFDTKAPPSFGSAAAHTTQPHVERDADLLDTLADFLQESEDGLQVADTILMSIEQGSRDSEQVNKLFRVFHSMKGLSSFLDLTDVTQITHKTETLLAQVRDGKLALQGSALDVVFEATEMMRGQLESIRGAIKAQVAYLPCPGKEELLDRLEAAMRGETLSTSRKASATMLQAEPVDEAPQLKETVKIATDLLERLARTADRLRALDAQLSQSMSGEVNELTTDLAAAHADVCEVAALMQMVSLNTLFSKMTRMVRDLSKKTGKLAKVSVSGDDTMVSRVISEKLGDPLVHMIRNAVDHGIEDADERKLAGKPPMGNIKLSAEHTIREGKRWVLIELRDDGKGLVREAIVNKAISKGLIQKDAALADEQIYDLIFAPGFSTAATVTAISGRGVGMDVVRRNIQSLGGDIKIKSREGYGSSFRISLPLQI